MYRVTWMDAFGNACQVEGDLKMCREVFQTLTKQAIGGNLDSAILLFKDGDCIDSWGT